MYICVATEARDKNGIRTAKELRRRFGHNFGGFYITQHTIAAVRARSHPRACPSFLSTRCVAM
eukprot:SAG11_NODE_575_length_8420_cov_2.398149_10_plen_63_part_00